MKGEGFIEKCQYLIIDGIEYLAYNFACLLIGLTMILTCFFPISKTFVESFNIGWGYQKRNKK